MYHGGGMKAVKKDKMMRGGGMVKKDMPMMMAGGKLKSVQRLVLFQQTTVS